MFSDSGLLRLPADTMPAADFSNHGDSSALARASGIAPPVETSRGKPPLFLLVAPDLPKSAHTPAQEGQAKVMSYVE